MIAFTSRLSLVQKRDFLIVEDERLAAADLQASVTDLGYKVVANVSSGEEAVACGKLNTRISSSWTFTCAER